MRISVLIVVSIVLLSFAASCHSVLGASAGSRAPNNILDALLGGGGESLGTILNGIWNEFLTTGRITLKVYGHYCGLNHGHPTYRLEPIDEIDAVCKAHDQCYDASYNDCRCDHEFLQGMHKAMVARQARELASGSGGSSIEDAATVYATVRAMIAWFERSSCRCQRGSSRDSSSIFEMLNEATPELKAQCK